MRNGNSNLARSSWSCFVSSYRTYEEWKLSSVVFCMYTSPPVLTVPMRNGNNRFEFRVVIGNLWFLPYLWGMETRKWRGLNVTNEGSYRTYEEWKLGIKYSLVSCWPRSYRTYEEWKLYLPNKTKSTLIQFLPYLWGMETKDKRKTVYTNVSSYRTYEEWKLATDSSCLWCHS